ncbi:RagB/SusD family nutrient uptake outer membrane protein [Chitinophaga sp. sic0106]|uniref:RagB/SusD family nutrient uptake outer membrane protein n=1 Tax=Chitinophaga sp. sic0106 TaxID=2854785 RepID=UPI001C43BC39|nr:RagB/SusD family nutrient uptake outer membrane protein [Chitinophaga sp. sic0106]MBV7529750.1 RagB/SusD family nutrient uptake outer membrane protein [Chitinophaga sp. sic0106]
MTRNIFLLLILAATMFSGCKKLLEEDPASFVSPDTFFETENQCVAALNGCYIPLTGVYIPDLMISLEGATDLAFLNSSHIDARYEISPANPGMGDNIWTACYQGVMYCNAAVYGIENATIAAEKKPALKAEAVALRALYYYVLTSTFNDVPFYTTPVNSLNALNEIKKVGRMDAKTTRDSLIHELQAYVQYLPQQRTSDVAQNRISAPFAWMLIGKMALWNKEYDICSAAMEEIRKIYGQLAQYPFTDTWFRNKNTPESIFEIQYTWSVTGLKKTTSTAAYFTPTKTSGTSVYDGVDIPELGSKANPFVSLTPTEYFMALYPVTDPRREIILAYTYNGSYFKRPMQNNGTGKAWMGPKFWCPGMDNIADGNNQKVFRYADALLMLAESANETGSTALAMQCLNEVKARAEADAVLTVYPGKDEFFAEVKKERARELMGEYGRKWDLVRWGTFYEDVSATAASEFPVMKANLRPYHEFYPIPDKEVVRSGGILTNPTYK